MDLITKVKANSLFQRFLHEYPKVTLVHPQAKLFMNIERRWKELKSYAEQIGTENKSNGHYPICPWSNPNATCGPDTCICYYITTREREIDEILKELYKP